MLLLRCLRWAKFIQKMILSLATNPPALHAIVFRDGYRQCVSFMLKYLLQQFTLTIRYQFGE
jgi:hypothetical protein